MTQDSPPQELKDTGYELFIAAVALLSIANIVFIAIASSPLIEFVLYFMNALCSLILLGDFLYRLRTAESRFDYFFRKFGWADLLASVPLPQFKVLRLFRLVRVFRLLNALGMRRIWRELVQNTAGSALLTLFFVSLLVMQFGSLAMLMLEADAPGANITSASDALWYMLATMSTVGYGDEYPITNAGRLLGSLVIVVGVGVFGTLTGFLANSFVQARKSATDEPPQPADRRSELLALRSEQQSLLERLDRMIEQESGPDAQGS